MVALTTNLGRSVPTPREVLEVIRPQLQVAAVVGPTLRFTFDVYGDGDQPAPDALFDALRFDAVASVGQWAKDLDKVFDGAALRAFVGEALDECAKGAPSDAVLDVLALDAGVCESIGHTLRRLAVPLGEDVTAHDDWLGGVAKAYFRASAAVRLPMRTS